MSGFLKIENPNLNKIISSQVPIKLLLNEDVVIAGGFPLAVYNLYLAHRDEYLPILAKKIVYKREYLKYTDIDIWPLETLNNINLNNYFSLNPLSPHSTGDGNQVFNIQRKSKWANTGTVKNTTSPSINSPINEYGNFHNIANPNLQFIKTPVSSPESLISNFDLNVCMVAWHKGVLYVSDKAHDDLSNQTLSFNNNYKIDECNFQSMMYRSLRYIKYCKRYDLEPSTDICEYIFKTYLASSSPENIALIQSEEIKLMTVSTSSGPYSLGIYKAKNLFNSLINEATFVWFWNRVNFKEEWTLFLLDNPYLKDIIKRIMENFPRKSTFKQEL